jgi:hypothetical protein
MVSIEDETDERDRFAFAEPGAVNKRNDVCKLRAAWWRLAFGNAGLVITGIAQFGKRLQGCGRDPGYRRAEIILHCILLVIGRALVTAGIATKKVYSLRLVSEGFELERKRFAARLELQLLRIAGRG